MSIPKLSVIIPVFNRFTCLAFTLESVRRASAGLIVETILVDDGSSHPLSECLGILPLVPEKLIRQKNRGLLFARLAGLAHATGQFTLFLDSDDLVGPEKFKRQLSAMDETDADISYTDTGRSRLEGVFDDFVVKPDPPTRSTSDSRDLLLTLQPAPHCPIFKTAWLKRLVENALFPPAPAYNSVAEIWFYHNAPAEPASVVYVPGCHTIVGEHRNERLTQHWEKLGIASLAVMEAFARTCPHTPDYRPARERVAEAAFRAWRAVPRGANAEFRRRLLAVWKRLGPGRREALGTESFLKLSRFLGVETTARFLHWHRGAPYEQSRSISDYEFDLLMKALPQP